MVVVRRYRRSALAMSVAGLSATIASRLRPGLGKEKSSMLRNVELLPLAGCRCTWGTPASAATIANILIFRALHGSRPAGWVSGLQNLAGLVGSGQGVSKISRIGLGHPDPNRRDPTRPATFDLTREQPCLFLFPRLLPRFPPVPWPPRP